jgi:two-component system OmpR family response regulator
LTSGNPIVVFIIEDDFTFLEVIHDYIKSKFSQLKIFKFTSGEDALLQLKLNPQIVILDYFLDSDNKTAQNGIEILLQIRKHDPSIRVIMLSAQEKPEVAASVIKYGAYDYVVKNETALNKLEIIFNHLTGHLILDQKVIINKLVIVLVAAAIIGLVIIGSFLL